MEKASSREWEVKKENSVRLFTATKSYELSIQMVKIISTNITNNFVATLLLL